MASSVGPQPEEYSTQEIPMSCGGRTTPLQSRLAPPRVLVLPSLAQRPLKTRVRVKCCGDVEWENPDNRDSRPRFDTTQLAKTWREIDTCGAPPSAELQGLVCRQAARSRAVSQHLNLVLLSDTTRRQEVGKNRRIGGRRYYSEYLSARTGNKEMKARKLKKKE